MNHHIFSTKRRSQTNAALLALATFFLGGCYEEFQSSPSSEVDRAPGAPDGGIEPAGWAIELRVDSQGLLVGGMGESGASEVGVGWGRALGSAPFRSLSRPEMSGPVIEIDLGWAVASLRNRSDGVEQSWTVAERPSVPALDVRVDLAGAEYLGSSPSGLVYRAIDGGYLLYSHATWIDAAGQKFRIPVRDDGGSIAMVVPESVLDRSSYPAVLDPIIGTAYSLTPTQLTRAALNQSSPAVAVGATSHLTVWSDDRNGVFPSLMGSFNDSTGPLLDQTGFYIARGRLSRTGLRPSVAYAGGVYLVTWASYDTVYAVRIVEGGGILDGDPLEIQVGGDPRIAKVTTDGTEFIVAWIDEGAPSGVRARRVAPDGTFPASAEWVVQDSDVHRGIGIAADPAGGYWVVFDDDGAGDRDLELVRLAADGTARDATPITILSTFADQTSPALAFSGPGTAMVAYGDSATQAVHAFSLQEGMGGAVTPGTPERVSAGSGEDQPSIVHDGASFRMGWASSRSGDPEIEVATLSAPARTDGVQLGSPLSYAVALAAGGGTVHAVWASAETGSTSGLDVYRRTSAAGTSNWSLPTRVVSQAPFEQSTARLARNNSRFLVTWLERRTGGFQVMAARVNPLGEFEDTTPITISNVVPVMSMVGVASNGSDFVVAWQERETRQIGQYFQYYWQVRMAHVSDTGIRGFLFDCMNTSNSPHVGHLWSNGSYVYTAVSSGSIYNTTVGGNSCFGGQFLNQGASVSDAELLVATSNAVYFSTSDSELYRVAQTTSPAGSPSELLDIGVSDRMSRLDVLSSAGDVIAYASDRGSYPVYQDVGLFKVAYDGSIDWHVPGIDTAQSTSAYPRVHHSNDGLFVTWNPYSSRIRGQRFTDQGQPVDPSPVLLVADSLSRTNGDLLTDFVGRSMMAYTARLSEQGWAKRIRVRMIDFRYDDGDPLGTSCATGFDCDSGFCVDGVCCDSACGYGEADCQACTVAAGAPQDGTCAVLLAGVECRAESGECDEAELCDGSSSVCPADLYLPADSPCGELSAGLCDLADRCTGVSGSCEARGVLPLMTVCRASRGGCDVVDYCDGTGADCADGVAPLGLECRAAPGSCDVAEVCDGATDVCPSDLVKSSGVECRPEAGPCDISEACDGASALCPVDAFRDVSQACRPSAGECDVEDFCGGSSADCPADLRQGPDHVCRDGSGVCDPEENCDGTSPDCPADAFQPDGTSCGGADPVCLEQFCSLGSCASQPVLCPDGAACSESEGGCPAPTLEAPAETGNGCGCNAAGSHSSPTPIGLMGFGLLVVFAIRRAGRRLR